MLIPVPWLADLGLSPTGVVHLGAHLAEERDEYEAAGWQPRTWVEANPWLARSLVDRTADSNVDLVIEGAVWSTEGSEMPMHIASNSVSSSLRAPEDHTRVYEAVSFDRTIQVRTILLATVVDRHVERFGTRPDFINLDIQGTELDALRSLPDFDGIIAIYSEVSRRHLYRGQALVRELDAFLRVHGLERVATRWKPGKGWGDALYVRTTAWRALPLEGRMRFLIRIRLARLRPALCRLVRYPF